MKIDPLCAMTQELLPSLADETVGGEAEAAGKGHLERCASCRRTYEAMTGIRKREEAEPIPVEAFVRRNRRRKIVVSLSVIFAVLVLFAGTMLLIAALSGGVDTWIIEDGGEMNALWQTGNDPGTRVPVRVRFTAVYTRFRLPWEKPDHVLVTELSVTGEDGEALLSFKPRKHWVPMSLPVRGESGITAPLAALNSRDPAEQETAGTLFSIDGMESFLLLSGEHALFRPAGQHEDADGLLDRIETWYRGDKKRLAVFREMEGWFGALRGED